MILGIPILVILLMFIFFLVSAKFLRNTMMGSVFECGFSSYFFSRFNFSIHYFIIGLIFLFLDMELCLVLPYFLLQNSSFITMEKMFIFLIILILALLAEWVRKKIEWNF